MKTTLKLLKKIQKQKQKAFSKMTLTQKRIAIAEDVLARIRIKQFRPDTGVFCETPYNGDLKWADFITGKGENVTEVCDVVNAKETCKVCAKGGLFMSLVGYIDNFAIQDMSINTRRQVNLASAEMKTLSRVFTPKQLSLIETAFEGETYRWNVTLTEVEKEKCKNFFRKYELIENGNKKRLTAICKNIIINKGIFILK